MLNENRKEGKCLRLLKSENNDIDITIIEVDGQYYFQCSLTDKNGNSALIFKELLFKNQINDLLKLDFDIVE
jgi:hypothetical protein